MNTFKSFAYDILKTANKPLHSTDITKLALKKGLLSEGKTPEMTMCALLVTDINSKKKKSRFIKTGPSIFNINPDFTGISKKEAKLEKQYPISKYISTKQKGDIVEARIAELVTLYGEASLSCYKPASDDEGIDLIVKKKGDLKKTMYIQIKSRFNAGGPTSYQASVKKKTLCDHYSMAMVFCSFDTEQGDLWKYIWFVPAPDFIKKANKLKGDGLNFVAGVKEKESNKWHDFWIDKRGLADKIIEQMKRI